MRRFASFALALSLGLAVPHTAPRAQDVSPASAKSSGNTIEKFLKIRIPNAPTMLADGSLLMRDWPDGVWQLYRMTPKRGADGAPVSYRPQDMQSTKLTSFPDGLARFSASRNGKRVVLEHSMGGNENTQLTLLELDGPAGRNLTPILANPKVQAAVNLHLRDDSGIIYSANDDSPTDFHLYRYDWATHKATKLVAKEGAWSAVDVTQDGSRVLVQRDISASDQHCYELTVATGELKEITIAPPKGTAACGIVGYMPGERAVWMTSDLKNGTTRLYLKDLATGAVREPLPALARYELDGAGMSEMREILVTIANEDGYATMRLFSLPDLRTIAAPAGEKGLARPASFRGRTLVWTLNNARNAGEAFATTYPKSGKSVTHQLTWTEDQGIDLGRGSLPELVRYPAFDGREIRAFVYLPTGYKKGTPIPFVVNYHGGPEGQHRPTFNATTQYLVSRGFGVMQPNVRGSLGYGREFQMLDDYKKRWDSVRDGVDAAEWLVKNRYARPGKIATYGGSYGGFMSVACIVEDQERVERGARKERLFGSCIDVVGIVNMKTFLEKTSDYRRKLREVEYGPLTDTEFLATISSIHKIDKIKVPVFIAHGFNDPRVPVQEAMQIAVALKERGLNPRVFIAPDEGHGFAKLDNRIYFGERLAQFLEETLTGPEPNAAQTRTARLP